MAKVSLRAYNQEIETMIDRGHLDEAIAHCKHILKTFPKHVDTYRLLGKAYLEYKRFPEAADIFSRVLVSAPSDFVANVGMSIIRDEENKLDDAIWHMERAFETQPSNAAIQSELQRLYGRREGVAPPRIRMTRGALAHMYVQGELYPQAISEIKSVLKDDPSRSDMQVLLARAYYRSGLKNDAAEVASAVLRTNPYNLDANRVLVEILGADHPESVQAYRQRVVELDPYAAQVTGSIFTSSEVPAAAVSLEHLDWNGQPVGMRPDWEATQAISLEREKPRDEQPDWLRNSFNESSPSQPAPVSAFDAAPPSAKPAEPLNDIPDFLREAGWGQSTGAFDESKSAFTEDISASGEAPIEQGELPDWVKALAPEQPAEPPAQDEDMPDWINKIGTSALPIVSESKDQADWINQFDQQPAQPAEEQPDWLKGFGETQQPATPATEEPDWLKGFASETEATPSAESSGELDWLSQLSSSTESKEAETPSNEFDFLNPLGQLNTAASTPSDEDFLKELSSQPEATPSASSTDEFDFLNEFAEESEQLAPSPSPEASMPEPATATTPGMSEEEQEDSFAWLENLAAKQGDTEGLLTKPEDRIEEEPEWLKQAKEMESSTPPMGQPAAHLEELGKSEQERDDSFAWLESLAAKQGANEGLLTKPEDRLEEEPEWIRQAKSLTSQPQEAPSPPAHQEEQPSIPEPTASLEDLGKSEQERDDAFAWLESLAAKQGATEGLLTKPEDRLEEEPEWIKHAKDVSAEHPAGVEPVSEQPLASEQAEWRPSLEEEETAAREPQEGLEEPDWLKESREVRAEEPASADETRVWLRSLEKEEATPVTEPQENLEEQLEWMKPAEEIHAEEPPLMTPVAEQPASADDTASWLQSLDDEAARPEPEISSSDDTAMWFKSLDEEELRKVTAQPAQPEPQEELPVWMQNLEEEKQVEESTPTLPEAAQETPESTEWMSAIEEEPKPVAEEPPKVDTGSLPSWLRGFEKEEAEESTFAAQEDLPAWLRDETGEVLVEPTKIEPTRATDWQPVEMKQPEPEPPTPEPVSLPPQPEPMDVVAILEEKIAAVPAQEPEKPTPPARPPKEPVMRKGTGSLTDPVLGTARGELSRSNLPAALENYDRLIKKGRFLEDVIYDLRDASYRYPVDVNIWQSLGDAYMRSNRLQDALDAYTKAEELLR